MAYKARVLRLERMRSNHSDDPPFRTLCFMARTGGRRRCPYDFIDTDRVPDFPGEEAYFLMVQEREPGSAWPRWKAIRRVNPDGSPYQG